MATSLKDYKIILECFHPAFRLTEPHIFCKYLGTEGLSERHEGEGSLYENVEPAHQLGKLASLYSIFRPEATVEERANGSLLVPAAGRISFCVCARGDHNKGKADNTAGDKENEIDPNVLTVRRTITISDDEDFSRFCIVSSLVKVIPGSTSLLSAVTVEDCIVRLFRNWLRQKAQQSADEDSQLLWLDQGHNVGIKLRVRDRRRPAAVFVNRDNTTAVSYDVYIEGVSCVFSARVLPSCQFANGC